MTGRMKRGLAVIACTVAGGVIGSAAGITVAEIKRPPAPSAPPVARATPSPLPPLPNEQTILVLGSDAMGGQGRESLNSNTDSMLLVHVNPAQHRVSVLSIPRDTRVPIPGHGTFKINAANVWGGPELACRTVSQLVGVPVDHYLVLNLRGVRALVDALGGLDVTVPKRLRYVDHAGGLYIDFQPGRQHMSGQQVEAYLRYRHDDDGDIGRVRRQQAFLLEFTRQALTPAHLIRLPAVWSRVQQHTRSDLSALEVLRLVSVLRGLDPHRDLELTSIPGRENVTYGPWYWIADIAAIEPFLERAFHKQPIGPIEPRVPRVVIENRTGRPQQELKPLLSALAAHGYRISEVRPAAPAPETHVIAQRGDRDGADRIKSLVGSGDVVVAGIGVLSSDFTLQLGRDWPGMASS